MQREDVVSPLLQVRPFPPLPPVLPMCRMHALLPACSWVPPRMLHSPRSRGSLHPGSAPGALGAWGKVLGRQSLGCEVAASADLLLLSVQAAPPTDPLTPADGPWSP